MEAHKLARAAQLVGAWPLSIVAAALIPQRLAPGFSASLKNAEATGVSAGVKSRAVRSTVPCGLGAVLGEMEVFLQNRNHLGGVGLHLGVLPVRRFAFEGSDRLPMGCNFISGELALEAIALQVNQLPDGPV